MIDPPVLHRIVARDGTYLAWHDYTTTSPAPPPGRPRVVLTNGLGTTPNFWKPLIRGLVPGHDVVHWDYPGHAMSEPARSGDYSMATLADDLRRVTEASSKGAPAVHIGFSMGVTVVLELYRARPDLVRGMVLIAGGADHPYASNPLFRLPATRVALQGAIRAATPVFARLAPVAKRLLGSPAVYSLGRATGALAAEAPREEMDHFFRAIGAMDPLAYWGSVGALLGAHASDVLPRVKVPVLVIAPGRDLMAPAKDLALLRTIPGVAWTQVPGTGHAILLEAGDTVAAHVRDFLSGLAS